MPTTHKNLIAENVTSYLEKIFSLTKESEVRCYRGQSDAKWKLKPSVMRDMKPDAENKIFSELMLEAPNEFGTDKSMFDKLVRAQHYALPTRLLDVSLNPLVGLYFACNEKEFHDKDAVVQVFDFSSMRVKYADSDTISLICNLARLSDKEREEITQKYKNTEKWNVTTKDSFRSIPAMMRLTQFVRVEKPYFLDGAEPRDLFKYFFVYPAKNNRRVIAQSGAFITSGLLMYTAPDQSAGFTIEKITIPASAKALIIKQLDTLNINSRTMFPEVEFASRYIKENWKKTKVTSKK